MTYTDHPVKELTNTLVLNYDMPEDFAKGLAEFLYDEDYRKVVKGKWLFHSYNGIDYYKCSCCGTEYPLPSTWNISAVLQFVKFCSYCGATITGSESNA